MDRLVAMAGRGELPERATGAAVFADISGFSALATRLERASGPERAAEQLSAAVDAVFGVLIDALHGSGGAAVSFAGDAVTGWIGDRPGAAAGPRAAACAFAMQHGVEALADLPSPDDAPVRVALRIGIATGPARRLLVGDPAVQRLDVVAGATVARAVAAQHRARPGEVVAARDVAGSDGEAPADGAFAPASRPPDAVAGAWWPAPAELDLPAEAVERWQHAAVLEHLDAGAPLLADMRRVAVLFARCPPIDFDAEAAAGARLDRLVRSAQHALADAGGTLLHVIVGDKGSYLVGAVGAPVAQPEHSRRLARAALDLQAAVPEGLAIGLAEGRAWAGLVGTPERSCYTLLGGVINRAARLMEHAPAGATYVSPRLARPLAGAFELHDAGSATLKGDDEPVPLMALTAARAAAPAAAGRPPIVGREPELERLHAALADAAAGEHRWASVRGAPGLGKSRLLHALTEGALGEGVVVVRVTGSAHDRVTPYLAWRDAFSALVGADPEPALATLPARDLEHAPLLRPVLPGAPDETAATRALSPEGRQESTQRLLAELLAACRRDRALLVSADDAQWLDSASAALLRRVARDLDGVMVVAAARPEPSGEDDPRADVRLDLGPLGRDDTLALVAQSLGVAAVPDAAARFIAARAGGHPLFAEQLAYALLDAGVLEVEGRSCRVAPGADFAAVEVPESVEGLIANRLDGMPADARTVAKVASVVGEEFSGALLGELGVPGLTADLERALDRLAAGQLIAGGPRYWFRHALIRDVVYGRLLPSQRQDLHRLVALHHEDRRPVAHAVLAEHWERAGVPDRAVEHLEVAGPAALQAGAFAECVELLERALALAPAADARRQAEWRWHAAQALYRLGRLDEARDFAEAAVARFDRPVPSGGPRLAAALGGQAIRQLAHRTPARRLLARAPAAERRRLLRATRTYLNLAELYYIASRKAQSSYAVLRQLNLAESVGPTPELVEAYGALCVICGMLGRRRMAERYAELAFAAAARVDDPYATAIIRHQASMSRSGFGDFDRVFADEDVAVDLFRRMGDLGRTRDCLTIAGVAAHQAGRRELAERYFTALLETRRGDEPFLGEVWAHAWLGAGALRAGAVDAALGHLARAAERRDAPGHESHAIVIDAQLALACWHAGRRAESDASAERARAAIAVTRGRPVGHLVLDGYAALAELAVLRCDDEPDGRRHVERGGALDRACRDLATFARVFPVGVPARWLYAGELAWRRGRYEDAREAWRRSRRAAARIGMRHELELAGRRLAERVS